MKKEIWNDIVGLEGYYQVSSFGRVRSVSRALRKHERSYFYNGKVLKLRIRRGYAETLAHCDGIKKIIRIHRAVALAFIPNPENKPFVNHKDGVKNNNHIDNLEWVTPKENSQHAIKTGLEKKVFGERHGRARLTENQVVYIRQSNYPNSKLSMKFGIHKSTIRDARNGKSWKHILPVVLFVLVSFASTAQSSSIPNVILDSMIWEIKRGRQCEFVMQAQANEIEKIGAELVHTNTALKLSQSSNQTLTDLLNNSRDSQQILGMQFQKDLSEQKRKTRRWRKVAVIESIAVIVGLIILL